MSGIKCQHNPQLGGLFDGNGHGGGFYGSRRVLLCYPICEGMQKTLTFFWLLLLVKRRNVSACNADTSGISRRLRNVLPTVLSCVTAQMY